MRSIQDCIVRTTDEVYYRVNSGDLTMDELNTAAIILYNLKEVEKADNPLAQAEKVQ